MLRSFVKLQRVDPGFVPQHVLAMEVLAPNFTKYTDSDQYRQLGNRIHRKRKDAPGRDVRGDLIELSIRSGFCRCSDWASIRT